MQQSTKHVVATASVPRKYMKETKEIQEKRESESRCQSTLADLNSDDL